MHIVSRFTRNIAPNRYLLNAKRHAAWGSGSSITNKRLFWAALASIGLTSWGLYIFTKRIETLEDMQELTYNYEKCDEIRTNIQDFREQLESKLCKADPDSARNKYNFIDKVVKKCAPAVFHIMLSDAKDATSVGAEISPFVYGSGFVIREDGWGVTNAHVVLNKESTMYCKMNDGTVYKAKVVDFDINIDIALLKIETDNKLPAIPLEEPGEVNIGEWVVALGSPLSLTNSISVGVISAVNRSAKELGLKNYSMSYLQTDALITFGNSGGPLVNLDSKVVGISSLRLTSGIAFAIPVEFCLKFLQKCRSFNPALTASKNQQEELKLFGLTTIAVTSDLMIDLMRKYRAVIPENCSEGLLVWKVLDSSFANRSGIKPGDIITHINGVPARNPSDMYVLPSEGEPVRFIVIQDGSEKEVVFNSPK